MANETTSYVVATSIKLSSTKTGAENIVRHMSEPGTGDIFYAAPFALNGELVGIGKWQVSALSLKWLKFCAEALENRGTIFEGPLPPPLERVSMNLTSGSAAVLATFSIDGFLVGSSVYLRGTNAAAEKDILHQFVDSLRKTDIVREAQTNQQPFAEILTISERPLHIAIAWGDLREEAAIIPDLATHFAAVLLFQ